MEMIVSAAIGAFILVVAVTAQRTVASSRNRIDDFVELESELRYIASLLRRDLGNFHRDGDPKGRKFIGMINEMDVNSSSLLRFWTVSNIAARAGYPEGDIYEIEYLLMEQDDRAVMVRRVQPNPRDQENPGGILTVIGEKIVSFNVRYLSNEGEDWMDQWPEERSDLPRVIEIILLAGDPESKKTTIHTMLIDFWRYPDKPPANNSQRSGRNNSQSNNRSNPNVGDNAGKNSDNNSGNNAGSNAGNNSGNRSGPSREGRRSGSRPRSNSGWPSSRGRR